MNKRDTSESFHSRLKVWTRDYLGLIWVPPDEDVPMQPLTLQMGSWLRELNLPDTKHQSRSASVCLMIYSPGIFIPPQLMG